MKRREFIGLAGGTALAAGATSYFLSARSSLSRADFQQRDDVDGFLKPDEREMLALASLAPSGHNTQPWFVQSLGPYHWIIGNDKTRWLPAVDPAQRETILSIGAFLQNLEYAAGAFGFACRWTLRAATNQDEHVMEVELTRGETSHPFDLAKLRRRRTVRSNFLSVALEKDDLSYLLQAESELIHYLPAGGKESRSISELTLEANRLQAARDPAQRELADWIRFSNEDAAKHRDGLTTAGMEIEGLSGWVVRNFYGKASVMKKDFRARGIENVEKEVSALAGWFLITSKDESVATLLETGRRMQRLFLRVRERNVAIHPMTQVLEEPATRQALHSSRDVGESVQFILRTGYLKNYPPPVSLRRPVAWFLRTGEATEADYIVPGARVPPPPGLYSPKTKLCPR